MIPTAKDKFNHNVISGNILTAFFKMKFKVEPKCTHLLFFKMKFKVERASSVYSHITMALSIKGCWYDTVMVC